MENHSNWLKIELNSSFFFYKFIYLFTYFWLRWVFVAVRGLSLVAASGGYSSLRCAGFSLRWLLLLWSTGSRLMGFSSCGTQAQQLWCTGLVAPWRVGSFQTRAQTHVPSLAGRFLTTAPPGKSRVNFLRQEIQKSGSLYQLTYSTAPDVFKDSGFFHLSVLLSSPRGSSNWCRHYSKSAAINRLSNMLSCSQQIGFSFPETPPCPQANLSSVCHWPKLIQFCTLSPNQSLIKVDEIKHG